MLSAKRKKIHIKKPSLLYFIVLDIDTIEDTLIIKKYDYAICNFNAVASI